MANISQNVNIEMLEKLPDGTFKRKYPKTRADDGTTFDEHLAESTQQAHLAKNIGLEDVTGNFVATELEGAMGELFTNVSSGKDLVGGAITGVDDSVVIPTDPTFNDLASAIGGISTGKKWASGSYTVPAYGGDKKTFKTIGGDISRSYLEVAGLDFVPSIILVYYGYNSSHGTGIAATIVFPANFPLGSSNSDERILLLDRLPKLKETTIQVPANLVRLTENAYISSTGFCVPTSYDAGGDNINWIAIE